MRKFLFFGAIFLFAGCALKAPVLTKAVYFTINSPLVKLNDAGFVRFNGENIIAEIYNSGVSVLKISIKKQICLNFICKNKLKFNEMFFKSKHYDELLSDILRQKPIFGGENLIKTKCGFSQNLSKNSIQYEVCAKDAKFTDSKNGVKIVLKELN